MKQHITSEQWNELNGQQQAILPMFNTDYPWQKYTIGAMIEFLGDDWWDDFIEEGTVYSEVESDSAEFTVNNDNLCDELWKQVKIKLCSIR